MSTNKIKLTPEAKAILAEHQAALDADEAERAKWTRRHDRRRAKWLAERGGFCGAKTRAGTPCKRRDLGNGGRCRLHGGLSTGTKTPEARANAVLNLPWNRKRASCIDVKCSDNDGINHEQETKR